MLWPDDIYHACNLICILYGNSETVLQWAKILQDFLFLLQITLQDFEHGGLQGKLRLVHSNSIKYSLRLSGVEPRLHLCPVPALVTTDRAIPRLYLPYMFWWNYIKKTEKLDSESSTFWWNEIETNIAWTEIIATEQCGLRDPSQCWITWSGSHVGKRRLTSIYTCLYVGIWVCDFGIFCAIF